MSRTVPFASHIRAAAAGSAALAIASLGFALPASAVAAAHADDRLIVSHTLIVDHALPKPQIDAQIRAARTYGTFWSTGDEALAREALADDFTDRTLPPGRPQGIAGALAASKVFHAAVPDVKVSIEQMIVAGDRVVTHLHFTGHFSGTFNGLRGQGQPVDFVATDIYRIRDGKIADNWHLEDNLTFLQQLGVVAR